MTSDDAPADRGGDGTSDGRDSGEGDDTASAGADGSPGVLRRAAGMAKTAASGAAGFVADKRFERTPAGRARQAAEDGARTFHIRLDLDEITHRTGSGGAKTSRPDVSDAIGAIEAEGWHLDSIEYLTEVDEWERTDADGSVTRGSTPRSSAVMLFRRTED